MHSKMYILVKRDIPSHKCLAIAHGVLMAHLKFQDDPDYQEWLKNSFRKVVCEVSPIEWESARLHSKHIVVTESGLGDMEIGLVFCPRVTYPLYFKWFKLMKM